MKGIRLLCYEYIFIGWENDKELLETSIAYEIRLF